MYTAMFLITGRSRDLTQEMSEDQELRLLVRMISQDLQAVQYLTEFTKTPPLGGQALPSGLVARLTHIRQGDYAELSFHSATPSRQHRSRPEAADPELHEVGYYVKEDLQAGTLNLIRREDYYLNEDLESGGATTVLANNVEAFKLECLLPAAAPGQQQEQWVTEWNSANQPAAARLPVALRLTLGQLGKSGRHLTQTVELNLQLLPATTTSPPGGSAQTTTPPATK